MLAQVTYDPVVQHSALLVIGLLSLFLLALIAGFLLGR